MIRSNADRSQLRSLLIGKALARHGSMVMVSPSANVRVCSEQVEAPFSGPWARPLMNRSREPQMPSRQS